MQALVELIDRYQPGFADQIRPAALEEIDELESLAGSLPGAYRRFLATMGGNMAGFAPLQADFNLEDRILNYQLNDSLRASSHLLIAAGGPLDPGGSLFMDRSEPYDEDDALLVVIPYSRPLDLTQRRPFHAGLEEFLYLEAYRSFRLKQFIARAELALRTDVEPSLAVTETVFAIALNAGFQRLPRVARCALFERGDAALVMYRHPQAELFSFQIGANEQKALRRTTELFVANAPVRILN